MFVLFLHDSSSKDPKALCNEQQSDSVFKRNGLNLDSISFVRSNGFTGSGDGNIQDVLAQNLCGQKGN